MQQETGNKKKLNQDGEKVKVEGKGKEKVDEKKKLILFVGESSKCSFDDRYGIGKEKNGFSLVEEREVGKRKVREQNPW
jgi:hypothetical protein